jgi:hypothetical protein
MDEIPKNRPFLRVKAMPTCGGVQSRPRRSLFPPSQHLHHHSKTSWTEPVRYWHKVSLTVYPNHIVLWQTIMEMLATLPSIIVTTDDNRLRRRLWANTTLAHARPKPLSNSCYKCLTLDNLCGSSTYLR